ncbi:MAG TPA: DUF4249 family protein [Longimicrobiales bacterium]|nr:DUF4249 family protein [Longimicrobiales bacterium]
MRKCVLLVGLLASACTIQDVEVAEPVDMVVAEIMLRAGDARQTAVLHRTVTGAVDSANAVLGARVEVTSAGGQAVVFTQAADSICIVPRQDSRGLIRGTCYATPVAPRYNVLAGETYSLRITLPDGGVMTGSTKVPADFRMLRPTATTCSVPIDRTFNIEWTASSDAWVYASGGLFRGLRTALAARGIPLDDEPLRLFGLSISNRDTSVVFPTEFGLFQRFDEDKTAALAAIQGGLPDNVTADIIIAAADRNYVNWERGGNFNPSGAVRIASIRGAGTGVFGSLVPKAFQIRVNRPTFPAC